MCGSRPRQVPRLTSCGSQAGDQCPKKQVIFLLGLPELKIGYEWGSMALNWCTSTEAPSVRTAELRSGGATMCSTSDGYLLSIH